MYYYRLKGSQHGTFSQLVSKLDSLNSISTKLDAFCSPIKLRLTTTHRVF